MDAGVNQRARLLRSRNKDRKAAVRRFAKSGTVLQDNDPVWNETIAVAMPPKLEGVPIEELYLHVLMWDYETLQPDELVAQAIIPMVDLPERPGEASPHRLIAIPGQEGDYNLDN